MRISAIRGAHIRNIRVDFHGAHQLVCGQEDKCRNAFAKTGQAIASAASNAFSSMFSSFGRAGATA